MLTTSYLPYLLPPLLGALIGYVTNYIAIRMLFRPLTPWRVAGLRVPLTPGIIPARRAELARRMGEMVGDHLLTADDVGQALNKETIRLELRMAVTEKLGRLLDHHSGPLVSLVPAHFKTRFDEIVQLGQNRLAASVLNYLASDRFEEQLRSFLHEQGEQLLARDLNSLLTPERNHAWQAHLDERYTRFFQSPATSALVGGAVDRKVAQLLASQRPLREHLPNELVEVLLAQVEKELPPLIEKFGDMFQDPAFRAQLVKKGKKSIDSFLDSLSGLAGLLSGFVDLKKLYAKIPEFLDRAGDEIAGWLRQPRTREQLAVLLRQRVDQLLDRPVASLTENLSPAKVAGAQTFIRDQVVTRLQSRATIDTALILTESAVDRIKDRPFNELLTAVLPDDGLNRGVDEIADYLLDTLRSEQLQPVLKRLITEQTSIWIYEKPLGVISAPFPQDLRREIDISVCHLVEEMLKQEAPRLVETLNVRRMVEDKVNGLDLLQVEDLLMGVMKEQFKYINLFGAFLGFLIGCINLLALLIL
ncbi:MAG: DUF445 family protein [Pelovirga sp.]